MFHPTPNAKGMSFLSLPGSKQVETQTTAFKISDDVLVEIFDACRLDNTNPDLYPQYWWHKLAHVCRRWRRVLLESPNRLGTTLICTSRTPVKDLLAHSPPLPIIVYYGNPEPLDTQDDVNDILLALQHPDRVRRINLHLPSASMRKVFRSMQGPFPVLDTLQLYCSSYDNKDATLPSTFEAPNLQHLQLSDFTLVPQRLPPLTTAICPSSLVTFSLGEVTPVKYQSPALLAECLAIMPQLKRVKIGYLFPVERKKHEVGSSRKKSPPQVLLANLEEIQFKGESEYIEDLSARISAPSLKKLSITFTDAFERFEFPFLLGLISGAADLSFPFARVRHKGNFSLVMDHKELWTGCGAFELIFDGYSMSVTQQLELTTELFGALEFKLSAVKSLLLEDAQGSSWKSSSGDRAKWHRLLRFLGGLETLRVANWLVSGLDSALQPNAKDEESVRALLPKLRTIVCYGAEVKNFEAFVASRKHAGMDVKVESGRFPTA
jgi:hypothetical protein